MGNGRSQPKQENVDASQPNDKVSVDCERSFTLLAMVLCMHSSSIDGTGSALLN
jgi:hypothetical protein